MAKKEETIVIKKIYAGGHGHHGGAWKVAFADFMTALMCFFLVMWLMSADDSTKAEIAKYFSNPQIKWKLDSSDNADNAPPLGDKVGVGDSILSGADGQVPEELVAKPMSPPAESLSEHQDLKSKIQSELDAVAYGMDVSLDALHFSVAESELFEPGELVLKEDADLVLSKIGKVLARYPGYARIEGHVDHSSSPPAGLSPYEFTMGRAVAVMQHFVERRYMAEERISPMGRGARKPYSSQGTKDGAARNGRIEFVLTRMQNLD